VYIYCKDGVSWWLALIYGWYLISDRWLYVSLLLTSIQASRTSDYMHEILPPGASSCKHAVSITVSCCFFLIV